MSTSRRRPTGGIRRPQVAGRPRTGRAEEAEEAEEESRSGTVAVDERSTPAVDAPRAAPVRSGAGDDTPPATGSADTTGTDATGTDATGTEGIGTGATEADPDRPDADADEGTAPRPGRLRLPPAPSTRKGTATLLVVTVLLTVAAAFSGFQWYSTQFAGPAANSALTDVGATAEVSREVGDAVTKVYSFDHARLEQAEDEARAVITPEFQPEFDRIFGSVRELAPQQEAVVTATIPKSAVASITGDRATVYLFVNQVIRRQADGGAPQEGSAAARLRVDAELVDGSWKIAAMTPA